jgi:5S rRNA maturation endonuclease (ribonuclease M5)
MGIQGIGFKTCVERFADEVGINGKTRKVLPEADDIARWSESLFCPLASRAKEFLNVQRGLTDQILKEFKIGYDSGSGELCIPIFSKDRETIHQVKFIRYDLVTGNKSIRSAGKTALFGIDKISEKDSLGSSEIVVCEGELDAMVLHQNGLPSVSGTGGAKTWKSEWTQALKDHNIIICYDSDDAGREGARKVAEELSVQGSTVRIADLYGKSATEDRNDVTDFFVKDHRTADEFRSIANNSPNYEKTANESLQLTSLLEDSREIVKVSPAQDYVDGVFYYAVQVRGRQFMITSQKNWFSFKDSVEKGIQLRRAEVDKCGFSPDGIRSFLRNEAEPNPKALFEAIVKYISRYIVLKDPDCFSFIALWVMGTYIYRAFRYFPYLHLIGEKQSGKTLLMDVLAAIAFNGELSANSTEAVLFRDVQNNQPTLFLDEVERYRAEDRERYGSVMAVLKVGFCKNGRVKRCGGRDKDKIHSFAVYSPKVLAGINEIDDVLRDRTIRINMIRRLTTEPVERYRENKDTMDLQRQLRDELYQFGLLYGSEIARIYENSLNDIMGLEHLSNREYDIWCPIILLANCVDACGANGSVTEKMVRSSRRRVSEHRAEDNVENQTAKLLLALKSMVIEVSPTKKDGDLLAYDTGKVFEFFKGLEEFAWLEHKTSLTRQLRRLEIRVHIDKINGKSTRLYMVNKRNLQDYSQRYIPGEDESVTVTMPVTPEVSVR